MGKVYLNDIDIDIFAKYFNKTNYTDSENTLMYNEVNISGNKYTTPIKYNGIDKTLYTVEQLGSANSVTISKLDNEKIYIYPYVTGFLNSEDETVNSIEIPLEDINTLNILDYINLSFSLKKIHGYTNDDEYVFNNNEFIVYTITHEVDTEKRVLRLRIDTLPNITKNIEYEGNDVFKDKDIMNAIINSNEIDYEDIVTGSTVKSVTVFGGKNMTQLVSISKNSGTSALYNKFSEFRIITYPYVYTVPMVDNDGNYVYQDQNGKLTTLPSYPNRFYKHQKAIRKAFFDIVESGGWQHRVDPHTVVLIRKGNKKQLAYYYNMTKQTSYEFLSNIPDGESLDPNIPIKSIFDNPSSGIKNEYIKNIVYGDVIDTFPRFKTYIGQNDDIAKDGFTFEYIEGLNENSFKTVKNKPIILDVNSRTIEFIGSSTKYDVSSNETINVKVGIGLTSSEYNNEEPVEFTVNNLNGEEPYILFPIVSDKNDALGAEAILSLANSKVYVGSMSGKITVTGYNLTDVHLSIGSQKLPVLTAEEVGYNSDDVLIGLGGDTITQSIFFFKVPLKKINISLKHTVICTLTDYQKPFIKINKIFKPKVGKILEHVKDFFSEMSLLRNVISPMPSILKDTKGIVYNPIIKSEPEVTNTDKIVAKSAGTSGFTMMNPRVNANCRLERAAMLRLSAQEEEYEEEEILVKGKYTIKTSQFISYKYSVHEESIVTYYENPYTVDPLKMYLKKTERILPISETTVGESFGKYIYLYSEDSAKSSSNDDIVNHFKVGNTYIDDGIEKLRGSLVNEDVFYNNRKNAFKNSLEDILKNDSGKVINPLIEFYKADGKDRMYNYCTSIINLIKEDYRVPTTIRSYGNKIFIDPISNPKKLVFQSVKYVTPGEISSLPFIRGVLSSQRSFIQKLAEKENFPLEKIYEKYLNDKTELENIISRSGDIQKVNNTNLKYYERNKTKLVSSYTPSGNYERQLMGNSITNFVHSGSQVFLKFDINNRIIEKGDIVYDIKLNSSSESSTYKKVYIDTELTKSDLESIIADLIIPNDNGEIMEVINVNI